MTDQTSLDTTIVEPDFTAGEVELLLFAIQRSRATFAWKCGGLDAEALRRAHPPSAMTLGGLLKHMARVEDMWTAHDFTAAPMGPPWNAVDFKAEPEWEWRTASDDTPDELYGLWQAAVARSRAALTAMLATGDADQPSKYVLSDGRSPNLRRVLVDMHDEYARHVGHADVLREAIDGLVGEDPPQS